MDNINIIIAIGAGAIMLYYFFFLNTPSTSSTKSNSSTTPKSNESQVITKPNEINLPRNDETVYKEKNVKTNTENVEVNKPAIQEIKQTTPNAREELSQTNFERQEFIDSGIELSTSHLSHVTKQRPSGPSKRHLPTKNAFKQGETYSTAFTPSELSEVKESTKNVEESATTIAPVTEKNPTEFTSEPTETSTEPESAVDRIRKKTANAGGLNILAQMGAAGAVKLKKVNKETTGNESAQETQQMDLRGVLRKTNKT